MRSPHGAPAPTPRHGRKPRLELRRRQKRTLDSESTSSESPRVIWSFKRARRVKWGSRGASWTRRRAERQLRSNEELERGDGARRHAVQGLDCMLSSSTNRREREPAEFGRRPRCAVRLDQLRSVRIPLTTRGSAPWARAGHHGRSHPPCPATTRPCAAAAPALSFSASSRTVRLLRPGQLASLAGRHRR